MVFFQFVCEKGNLSCLVILHFKNTLFDAISSRIAGDHMFAETRLRSLDFTFITREMLFFELLDHSEGADYRGLSLKFLDGRYINSQGARV